MRHRFTLPVVLLVALVAGGPGRLHAQDISHQVLREGPDGFTVRIEVPAAVQSPVDLPDGGTFLDFRIPGFLPPSSEDAGRPGLPTRGIPFGLPEGKVARITAVRVLRSESFWGAPPLPVPERTMRESGEWGIEQVAHHPDPRIYGSSARYPGDMATLSKVMGWRFQRVQSLVLAPLSVVPAAGTYELAREVEIEVRFVTEPGARPEPRGIPVAEDAPGWNPFFDRILLNASSSAGFRRRPAPAALFPALATGAPHVRVRVGKTGPCRLTYADLGSSWPAGVPVSQVRLEERGYTTGAPDPFRVDPLPRRIEDNNQNGVFDDGDAVLFYGFDFADRFHPQPHEARYTYFHTYWLTADPAGGRNFDQADGFPAGAGYVLQDHFRDMRHVEEEHFYVNNPLDDGSLFYPPHLGIYWLTSNDVDVSISFNLPGIKSGGSMRVRAEWAGRDLVPATNQHFVSLDLNGKSILKDGFFRDRTIFTFASPALGSDTMLVSGRNSLRVRGRTSVLTTLTGAAFDGFEVSYDRTFQAANDALVFNTTGATGDLEYEITGFTSPDILVLDVTNPLNPVELRVTPTAGPGDYRLRLRLTANAGTRTVAAFVPAGVPGLNPLPRPLPPDLGTSAVGPGLGRDLLAEGAGSDYILITHPAFRNSWGPLIAQRESEGHRVFVCDVWEIYDQFAGGDKTPWAIQRFLSEAFRAWDPAPSYVLLGGDANEDYRKDTPESDTDWVPTMMHFASVPGSTGLELAGTDNWYVAFLRPGDPVYDVLPDMHVGRLPVASTAETGAVVQKLVNYASMSPGDTWRNRGVFLADDQYSTSITFTTGYCWKSAEGLFKSTTQALCDSIHNLAGLVDFECDTLFLASYLDTVPALLRRPGDPSNCPCQIPPGLSTCITLLGNTSRYARDTVTPSLLDKLNRGCLIWEFTGHANKSLITTEQIVQSRRGLSPDDVTRVNNLGKPFVFYGFACHLAEFEDAAVNNRSGGDCIGEALLLAPNRGAIATIASTGYEWLHTNPDAQMYASRYMFWDLPRDPDTGRPRRILGEAHSWAFGRLYLDNPRIDYEGMIRTYVYLGDPALQMDIMASQFDVHVNGAPIVDGTRITAPSREDSLSFSVRVSDDVDVDSLVVRDGSTVLPADRVRVTGPGARDRGVQAYTAAFKAAIRPENYDLVVEALDWLGRPSRFTMPVRVDLTFEADGRILSTDLVDQVDPASPIRVEFTSPVGGLRAEELLVFVDGGQRGDLFAPLADTTGRRWEAQLQGPWGDGEHTIEIRFAGHPTALGRVAFRTSNDTLSLLAAYAYPNPYEEDVPTLQNPLFFVYELSRRATRVELSVYTVKGRRVLRENDLPALSGRNAFRWDLRDEAGDEVANGVYLFQLHVIGDTGGKIQHLERVAVSR